MALAMPVVHQRCRAQFRGRKHSFVQRSLLPSIAGTLAIAFGAGTAGCAKSAPRTTTNAELLDYLIGDVCVDGKGAAVGGDPAGCPAHRNIAIGEASPYLVTDFERNTGATYSAMSSFPVNGPDGTARVMVTKNLQGGFSPLFRFSFNASRDGYDLIDTSSPDYVSFMRTSDGGCFDQVFSRSPTVGGSDRAGGWLLFPQSAPSSWPAASSVQTTTYKIQLTTGRPGCTDGHATGRTFWNAPARYRFETGKTLMAIRSDHFASTVLGRQNNALERFYFTREYGFTRWEAWIPQARCFSEHGEAAPICHPESPDYALRGRCSVLTVTATSYPGLDLWGDQKWVRVDCRDETKYVPLTTPALMRDRNMARNDGVQDIQ
jgi:hypothetical protein